MDFASVVLFHRKQAGLNREELAKLAGVGKTVVFDIEHGKQSVRFDTLQKIFQALNIQINWNSPLIEKYKEQMLEQKENEKS